MTEVIDVIIVIAVFGLITSPQYLFRKIDTHILEIPEEENHVSHTHTPRVITNISEEKMLLDETRLSALDRVIASCQTPDAKRIWEIKKAEYLRQVKWNRLVEMSGASERIKGQ